MKRDLCDKQGGKSCGIVPLSRVGVEIFLSAVYGRRSEKYYPDLDSIDIIHNG